MGIMARENEEPILLYKGSYKWNDGVEPNLISDGNEDHKIIYASINIIAMRFGKKYSF